MDGGRSNGSVEPLRSSVSRKGLSSGSSAGSNSSSEYELLAILKLLGSNPMSVKGLPKPGLLLPLDSAGCDTSSSFDESYTLSSSFEAAESISPLF